MRIASPCFVKENSTRAAISSGSEMLFDTPLETTDRLISADSRVTISGSGDLVRESDGETARFTPRPMMHAPVISSANPAAVNARLLTEPAIKSRRNQAAKTAAAIPAIQANALIARSSKLQPNRSSQPIGRRNQHIDAPAVILSVALTQAAPSLNSHA